MIYIRFGRNTICDNIFVMNIYMCLTKIILLIIKNPTINSFNNISIKSVTKNTTFITYYYSFCTVVSTYIYNLYCYLYIKMYNFLILQILKPHNGKPQLHYKSCNFQKNNYFSTHFVWVWFYLLFQLIGYIRMPLPNYPEAEGSSSPSNY